MNYGEVKTLVADYIDRNDLTTKIPTFIKLAVINLERPSLNNFNHMIKQVTSTLTNDYISVPSDYKEAKALFVTASGQKHALVRTSYYDMIKSYPLGNASKNVPKTFAYLDNKFYCRPYPTEAYSYEFIYYAYTADLSADEDTNFWTTAGWDALLYQSLLEAIPYLIYDKDLFAMWQMKRDEAVSALLDLKSSEVISGSFQTIGRSKGNPFDFYSC